MRRSTTFWLVAAAAVALSAHAPDALAKKNGNRGRRNRTETVRLATPAGSAVSGARGSITITETRAGQDAVLHVRGLDRRTTYEIVDGATGALLGEARSNARGRVTFDLVPGVGPRAKGRASADGSDATDVPDVVEVVDPDTGDVVLTGDTTGDLLGLYGYASLGNMNESVSITMGSDPFADMEYFDFTYLAPMSEDGWYAPVFTYWADTATDGLPLGVSSVIDLAGRRFQVRDANGDVAFRGALPDVEAYEVPELPDCPSMPDWDGTMPPDGNDGDDATGDDWMPDDWTGADGQDPWGGMPWNGGEPFDFTNWMDWGSDGFGGFAMDGFFGLFGKRGARDGATDPNTEPGTDPVADVVYTLWIEDGDGFSKAGDLTAPVFEPMPWDDPWMGGDPNWDDEWIWIDDGWTDDEMPWMDGGPDGWMDPATGRMNGMRTEKRARQTRRPQRRPQRPATRPTTPTQRPTTPTTPPSRPTTPAPTTRPTR